MKKFSRRCLKKKVPNRLLTCIIASYVLHQPPPQAGHKYTSSTDPLVHISLIYSIYVRVLERE